MNKFLFFLMLSMLSSCVFYRTDENFEKTLSQKDVFAGYGFLSNPDYYTRENIIKDFGKPVKQCLKGNKEILTYEEDGKELMKGVVLMILPLKYYVDDDKYKYAFVLEDNKLKEVRYQDIKATVYGFGFIVPPYTKKEYYIGSTPWEVYGCDKAHSRVSADISHMKPGKYRYAAKCYTDKILGFNGLEQAFDDRHLIKQGYSTVFQMASYMYDKERFRLTKKELELTIEKMDNLVKKEELKTKEVECSIFDKSSEESGLIFDYSKAICYSKIPNMLIVLENSNRFPVGDNNINTIQELKNVIESIKIN